MSSHGDVIREFCKMRWEAIEHALECFAMAQGLTPTADDIPGRLQCFSMDDTDTYCFDGKPVLRVTTSETRFAIEELWL